MLGTRTLAIEIADLASDAGFEPAGFIENLDPERCREPLEGLPVHWLEDAGFLVGTHLAVCGLATTHRSTFVEQAAGLGFRFATVVHPTARISRRAVLGEGTIVSAGSIIAACTTLGRHVLVNRGVLIGHHTRIGDFATVHPGANIAGACEIEEAVYIGMGAIVIDHTRIGSHAIVGAGAVVTSDLPGRVKAVGLPARIVEEGVEGK
ncbi:MAG: NeuD/PglB/VioB family sugar acetyltransferase [Gaiellaceae bacterium]